MRSPRRASLALAALAALALLPAPPATAVTIAYWRMEADLDPSAEGLRVANEVALGTPLLSTEAFIDLAANPNGTVPRTGSVNLGSVGATRQGGSNGINGAAAWYAQLDTASITLEFWARTGEGTATLFSRTTGGFDGIRIDQPNALRIVYHVSNGAGGATRVTLSNVHNMDATWRHYAFTYDAATGLGLFYVDGFVVASNDGPDNRPLVWGAAVPVRLGVQMDYAAAFNGTLDEVRIDDRVLAATQFLAAAEPGSGALALAALAAAAAWGRARRR